MFIGIDLAKPNSDWTHYGSLTAAPLERSVELRCVDCRVMWLGCMDFCECPNCGKPQDVKALMARDVWPYRSNKAPRRKW